MNKPKWLPRVLRGLRKAFFTVAVIIIILFMLTVVINYLYPPIGPVRYIEQPTVESPQSNVALNRSEE